MHLPARFSCGPQLCWSAGKRCFAPPLPPQGFGDALPRLDDGSSRPHPSPSSAPLLSSAFATLESGKPVSCLAFAKRSPLLDLQGAPGLWIGTSWQPQPGPQVCVCVCVCGCACLLLCAWQLCLLCPQLSRGCSLNHGSSFSSLLCGVIGTTRCPRTTRPTRSPWEAGKCHKVPSSS